MKLSSILIVGLTAVVLSGCRTAPMTSGEQQSLYDSLMSQEVAPLYDLTMLRRGAIDLLYSSLSFYHKNQRWPKDYAELTSFVKQSDGYLVLGEYKQVDFIPTADGRVKIRYIPVGGTNAVMFTLAGSAAQQ